VVELSAEVSVNGRRQRLKGRGNGPIDAFVAALSGIAGVSINVVDYHEHAVGEGAGASAATYIELRVADGRPLYGVGVDSNILTASLKAILSALNRAVRLQGVALPAKWPAEVASGA
jgi:2-isopropylmalate synthase